MVKTGIGSSLLAAEEKGLTTKTKDVFYVLCVC